MRLTAGARSRAPALRRCGAGPAREHMLQVLERYARRIDGPGHAAEKLGLHPITLRSRVKKLGIKRRARSR